MRVDHRHKLFYKCCECSFRNKEGDVGTYIIAGETVAEAGIGLIQTVVQAGKPYKSL